MSLSADLLKVPIKHALVLKQKDVRLLHEQHVLSKLKALIIHMKVILIKVRNNNDINKPTMVIPLVDYVIEMLGTTLDDQSDEIKNRVFSLEKLIPLIKVGKTHKIDNIEEKKELDIVVHDPKIQYRVILEQLIEIVEHVITTTKKKIQSLNIEKEKITSIDPFMFKDLLSFAELQNMFKLIITQDKLSTSFQIEKAHVFVKCIQESLVQVDKFNKALQSYSEKPNDSTIKKLPDWPFTLHRIIVSYIILLDDYSALRKLGRNVYLSRQSIFNNPRLLKINKSYPLAVSKCDEWFSNDAKNRDLQAQLAKYGKGTTEVTHTTIIDMSKQLNQGLKLVHEFVGVFNEFLKAWTSIDSIYISLTKPKQETPVKSEQISSSTKLKRLNIVSPSKTPSPSTSNSASPSPALIAKPVAIKQSALKDRNNSPSKIKEITSPVSRSPEISKTAPVTTRTRSGSNASTASNSSITSSLNSLRNNGSPIASPPAKSPTNLSRSSSLQVRRPISLYHSNAAFDIRSEMRRQERAAAAAAKNDAEASSTRSMSFTNTPTTTTTRPRSSSLQNHASSSKEPANVHLAAAATALSSHALSQNKAALKQGRSSSLNTHNRSTDRPAEARRYLVPSPDQASHKDSRSPSPLRSLRRGLDDILETPTKTKVKPKEVNDSATLVQPKPIHPVKKVVDSRSATPLKSALKSSVSRQNSSSKPKPKPETISPVTQKSPTPETLVVSTLDPGKLTGTSPVLISADSSSSPDILEEFPDLEDAMKSLTVDGTIEDSHNDEGTKVPPLTQPPSSSNPDQPTLKLDTSTVQENSDDSSIPSIIASPLSTEVVTPPELLETLEKDESHEDASEPGEVSPKPIIKKVRFTGVPPEPDSPPHSSKPKFWKPMPKPKFTNTQRNKSSLSHAAEALKQERLAFHTMRNNDADLKGSKTELFHDAANGGRMMGSLAAYSNASNGHKSGKWSSFKDKFS